MSDSKQPESNAGVLDQFRTGLNNYSCEKSFVALVRSGDERAFEYLYSGLHRALVSYVNSRFWWLKEEREIPEIVHVAFIKLHQHRSGLVATTVSELWTWLVTTSSRIALELNRKAKRRQRKLVLLGDVAVMNRKGGHWVISQRQIKEAFQHFVTTKLSGNEQKVGLVMLDKLPERPSDTVLQEELSKRFGVIRKKQTVANIKTKVMTKVRSEFRRELS